MKKRKWVHYLGFLKSDEKLLSSVYAACKVHALPSMGECPVLVLLETGIAGANIVTLKDGPIYGHLGDYAYY
ncbi:hypothetical protein [Thermoanaerobacterium thermosaccharolyticum]|uniref:hypothetical protein n=1 Tax=Thermoanaerobacterium thermosaccharolyticum TaxID=1517 RepID=UPI003DA998BB